MRIATWNVWWRFGDHERRAPAIASELRRVAADVVCLQEVWGEVGERGDDLEGTPVVDGPGAEGRFQAAELAEVLDMPEWRYSWHRSHEGSTFGNAILSQWPVTRTAVLPLPTGDHHPEYRTAMLAEIATPAGPVTVATTHLNFLWDHSHVRQEQVRAICQWMAAERTMDAPAILTGDMNADPMSDEIRMLTGRAAVPALALGFHDAWEAAGVGDGVTWSRENSHTPDPPFEGDKRIDFVLCSYPLPNGRGIPLRAERFGRVVDADGDHPSDHFGVAVDLTVSPR